MERVLQLFKRLLLRFCSQTQPGGGLVSIETYNSVRDPENRL